MTPNKVSHSEIIYHIGKNIHHCTCGVRGENTKREMGTVEITRKMAV